MRLVFIKPPRRPVRQNCVFMQPGMMAQPTSTTPTVRVPAALPFQTHHRACLNMANLQD